MIQAGTPEGVAIRRAEATDLLDVRRIESDVFPQPWPMEAFQKFLGEPGFLVAVTTPATDSGAPAVSEPDEEGPAPETTVVGYVVADVISGGWRDVGHVKDLAVAVRYRRQGVGTALLSRALSVLADRDVRSVKLEVRESNAPARDLYDAFGFELRRRLPHYYADGEDALVFVAPLDG